MNNEIKSLLIDDDVDDREIFLMCLNSISKDINCRTANNGAAAISLFESQSDYTPDYIFLDVNMPKMNGIECLKALIKFEQLNNTKILMYSTTSEKSVVDECRKLGAYDFVVKPAKTFQLKERLKQVFSIA